MRAVRCSVVTLVCLLCALPLAAQRRSRDPLTPAQIEQIREAGIYPVERVKLYTGFVNDHIDTIKGLAARAHSRGWAARMDSELLDLTALMDELGSNLDVYSDRKADIRKSLKPLSEASQRWLTVLRALPADPVIDLSKKDATASAQDVADQAGQMLREQTEYFKIHKDQRGQDRVEPQ